MEQSLNEFTAPSTKREAFEYWQGKGSQGLNKKQTLTALFEAGQNPIAQDIERFWKKKRKLETDTVSFGEFEELYNQLGNPKERLKQALIHFDKNKNGKIDREELLEILRAAGELENKGKESRDSYVDLILGLGDRNKDHELDIDELVTMIQDGLIKR